MKKFELFLCTVALVFGFSCAANAVPVFYGPTQYVSSLDVPSDFYDGGSATAIEDFEDGTLDFGITADYGGVIGPGGLTDSVDIDDGAMDGSGTNGHSWFSASGYIGVTFTFETPVTAAGIVWTDGYGLTTFEAFGANGVSLGTIGPEWIATGGYNGQTDEDHFFGVKDLDGIYAIKLSNTGGGIEVDHVQFGDAYIPNDGNGDGDGNGDANPVPEPATLLLLGTGLLGLAGANRKKMLK